MNKDAMAFLDDETVEKPEVTEEPEGTEQEPEPAAEAEPEKAEAQEPEPEQTGEDDPGSTPEPEPQNDRAIPVTALLDEREKRQEAQREAAENARRTRELQAQLAELQKPKEEVPDWFEDPAQAATHQSQQIERQFQSRLMQQSKFLAEREFGAEAVGEALAYFDKNPAASQQFVNHPSPFHAAVEFYQRQKTVEEIGADPEAYKASLREQIRAAPEAELKANSTVQQKPKAPPPSMAAAPSSGQGGKSPGNGFDALFPE